MNHRLKIITQPLKISHVDLDELEENIQNHWDHKAEVMSIRRIREQRKLFKTGQ